MSSRHFYRRVKVGAAIRFATEELVYEDDLVRCRIRARDKLRLRAELLGDPDWYRGNNTRGWKAHKHSHQWEHGAIEREKHARSRRRKEERRARR